MIHGIINVLKPSAMSSHDVVGRVRRIFGMKKVGHSGTLDPLAAGVLPVFLGRATRLIEYSGNEDKTYRAELAFGFATDTEDSTGRVVETRAVPKLSAAGIETVLKEFIGTVRQRPSKYSAINVNGVKAYKLARRNEKFELPERDVEIKALTLISFEDGRAVIEAECSKGTYIRALVRDMGERLGTLATMTYLLRLRVGDFSIETAATLEELETRKEGCVLPVDASIQRMAKTICSHEQYEALLQGRAVTFAGQGLKDGDVLRVYDAGDILVGIGRFDEAHHIIRPHKMFNRER